MTHSAWPEGSASAQLAEAVDALCALGASGEQTLLILRWLASSRSDIEFGALIRPQMGPTAAQWLAAGILCRADIDPRLGPLTLEWGPEASRSGPKTMADITRFSSPSIANPDGSYTVHLDPHARLFQWFGEAPAGEEEHRMLSARALSVILRQFRLVEALPQQNRRIREPLKDFLDRLGAALPVDEGADELRQALLPWLEESAVDRAALAGRGPSARPRL